MLRSALTLLLLHSAVHQTLRSGNILRRIIPVRMFLRFGDYRFAMSIGHAATSSQLPIIDHNIILIVRIGQSGCNIVKSFRAGANVRVLDVQSAVAHNHYILISSNSPHCPIEQYRIKCSIWMWQIDSHPPRRCPWQDGSVS
ncbi:hypothetical protein BDW22DRAFT_1035840 [Trametopsis cervina]|nr:hypothetical protein BDW22DRAFT_1035840 [Trametopsis cervina]